MTKIDPSTQFETKKGLVTVPDESLEAMREVVREAILHTDSNNADFGAETAVSQILELDVVRDCKYRASEVVSFGDSIGDENFDVDLFVDKYEEMNPETEDLLFDGRQLRNGMKVLPDITYRADIVHMSSSRIRDKAMLRNRWCTVDNLEIRNDINMVSFVGVYEDGTKRKHEHNIDIAWVVKKDSIPEDEPESPITHLHLGVTREKIRDAIKAARRLSVEDYPNNYLADATVKSILEIHRGVETEVTENPGVFYPSNLYFKLGADISSD
jgi:hypothetical protein